MKKSILFLTLVFISSCGMFLTDYVTMSTDFYFVNSANNDITFDVFMPSEGYDKSYLIKANSTLKIKHAWVCSKPRGAGTDFNTKLNITSGSLTKQFLSTRNNSQVSCLVSVFPDQISITCDDSRCTVIENGMKWLEL